MTLIYIENLAEQADTTQTRALFETFGAVASIHLTPGVIGGSGGFALLEMDDAGAHRAIAEIDGTVFKGATLSIREATTAETSDTLAPISAQSDEPPLTVIRQPYEVTEVEKVSSPGGAVGDDWYRYVLARRASQIVGFRRGSLMEVTAYAKGCAEAFNDRNLHLRSNYYRRMIPRGHQPTTRR